VAITGGSWTCRTGRLNRGKLGRMQRYGFTIYTYIYTKIYIYTNIKYIYTNI
jgi:hypothetical protein